uniref:GDP-mannose 4,6-dehydratase n=1 Tax=Algoriphagus sp. TaxID=1872435 RepID=UPI0040479D3A
MNFIRIVVLGSNSFAGAAFVLKALGDGYEVIGFNRSPEGQEFFLPYKESSKQSNYKFYQADINKDLNEIIEIIDSFKPEVVVDFAGQGMVAESWENPSQWYTTNIVAKVKLHDLLRKRDFVKKYIRISTPEVYGSQDHLIKESWDLNPSTPYAVSHASIDLSLRAFNKNYSFPVVFTKFANFYGPGQQLYRIIPRTIIYALTGKQLHLHGGGTSIRAFIHSADVSNGIMDAIKKGQIGETYHFSPNNFYTIKEVVEIICKELSIDFDDFVTIVPDRAGKDKAYLMDSNKSRIRFGWNDNVGLVEGINDTVKWVKENLEEINKSSLDYIHKV